MDMRQVALSALRSCVEGRIILVTQSDYCLNIVLLETPENFSIGKRSSIKIGDDLYGRIDTVGIIFAEIFHCFVSKIVEPRFIL